MGKAVAPAAALSPLIEKEENGLLQQMIRRVRTGSRNRRTALFLGSFRLGPDTRLLDLGGANGAHVRALLAGTAIRPENVHVADVDHAAVQAAADQFGYVPVPLSGEERLPFADGAFDIVLCSSVLEHVTVPPQEVWRIRSGREFRRRAQARQQTFAREIARVGRGYFVQVPYRWFPVETHTWLPFVSYLPRRLQCALIRMANRVWIKKTDPDFHLPTVREMRACFPEARIGRERLLGLTKSVIAIRSP